MQFTNPQVNMLGIVGTSTHNDFSLEVRLDQVYWVERWITKLSTRPQLKWKTVVVGLRLTTSHGDTLTRARPVGGPSQLIGA